MNWLSCSASEFSNCHVYGLVLNHPAFIFEKGEQKRTFYLTLFLQVHIYCSLYVPDLRSVSRSVGTDHASFVQPRAVYIPAKRQRCVHNNNNFGKEEEEIFCLHSHQSGYGRVFGFVRTHAHARERFISTKKD